MAATLPSALNARRDAWIRPTLKVFANPRGCPGWVMYGRRPRCKRNLTISEAFGCGHVFGL